MLQTDDNKLSYILENPLVSLSRCIYTINHTYENSVSSQEF